MLLRRSGVDAATQQYLMGHTSYEMTLHYQHEDYESLKKINLLHRLEKYPYSCTLRCTLQKTFFAVFTRFIPQNEKTKVLDFSSEIKDFFGRSGEIRTRGLLNPIQARYQAALHPD